MERHTIYFQRAIFVIILGLVASFFMFYQLGEVPPPYPWSDEASAGHDAKATLRGEFSLYYPDQGGGGNLWVYLTALAFLAVTRELITMRWLVGLVGVMTVLVTFGALIELFRTFMPLRRAQLLAFIGALWMAVAAWFVTMSRIAWPPALTPLAVSATFLLLWRGLRTGRTGNFIGAGIILGLGAYLYLPTRFTLLVPLAFFTLEGGLSWLRKKKPFWWPYRQKLLLALATALLVALPMLSLFIVMPEAMVGRAMEVQNQEDEPRLEILSRGLLFHLDALGLTFNLNRSPFEGLVLGPITTVFFLIGLVVTLFSLYYPACRYLLLWWFILLLPSLIAPPRPNNYDPTFLRRSIGALPATFAMVALGVAFIEQKVSGWLMAASATRFRIRSQPIFLALTLAIITLTAWQTLDGFFIKWAKSEHATRLFYPKNVDLVNWLNQHTTPDSTFIFPIRQISRSSTRPWIYATQFLYDGSAGYILDDENDVPAALLAAVKDKRDIFLLTEKRVKVDPKRQFLYLLNRLGQQIAQEDKLGFEVRRFELDRWELASPAQTLKPEVIFGDVLKLRQAEWGGVTEANRRLVWLELVWENLASRADYQVTVRLEDGAGHLIAQQDKLLLNNLYTLPTSEWAANSVEKDYYWLEIPPTILPGEYILKVGVYEAGSTVSLAPRTDQFNPDLTFSAGELTLEAPQTGGEPPLAEPVIPVSYPGGHGPLTLLGLEAPVPSEMQLGQAFSLPLLLRLEAPMVEPLKLQAELVGGNQSWPLALSQKLTIPADWPAQSPFLVYLDGRTPRDLPSGTYELRLSLTGQNEPEMSLGQVKVAGRERVYEAPDKGLIPVQAGLEGDSARLLGYSLDLKGGAEGGQVALILYWQPLAETDISYKVFVHLLDSTGNIIAQIDREPQAGAALTTSWLPGEIIADTIELPPVDKLIDVQAIAIGMYNPQTGQRLSFGDNDHILLQLQP